MAAFLFGAKMPRLLRLLPLPLVVLPLVWIGWTLFNGVREHSDSFAGLPRAQNMALLPWLPHGFQVIDRPGFVLGYAEYWRNPLWVAYRLEQRVGGPYGRRPEHFRVDARTFSRVRSDAYTGSGFDRGHMAPNYAMSRFHGRAAQLASFRMSNIVPQQGRLNQKLWQRLEEIEADVYAAGPRPLWVVMGPVFDGVDQRLDSGVAVPDAFYRIWARYNDRGEPQVLAFLVPQTVSGYEPLDDFAVTVDAVEAVTGLDFFHRLDESLEARLESGLSLKAWQFARHARRAPRY